MDVDIITQSLSEIIQRPRLGTINVVDVSGYVPASTDTLVMAILGAGIHFGGYIWADDTDIMNATTALVIADGNTVVFPTARQFIDYNFTQPVGAEGFMVCCDDVNFKYAWNISQGKTWETSYLMYIREGEGRTPNVNLKFVYAAF